MFHDGLFVFETLGIEVAQLVHYVLFDFSDFLNFQPLEFVFPFHVFLLAAVAEMQLLLLFLEKLFFVLKSSVASGQQITQLHEEFWLSIGLCQDVGKHL